MTEILDLIRPGIIVHVRGRSVFPSRAIRRLLGIPLRRKGLPPCWGNHDALGVLFRDGSCGIGDMEPWRGKVNTLESYRKGMIDGKWEVRLFEVIGATQAQERRAAHWWTEQVVGRFYDFAAYPRLIGKCLLGDIFPRAAGWTWANWCTESVADAWRCGACCDWTGGNRNPTPLTVEKRAGMYPTLPGRVTLREIGVKVSPRDVPALAGRVC